MTRFLLRRLVYLASLVVIASSAAYFLAATQLNPRARYEGRNPPPPEAAVDAALDAVNMNDKTPVVVRFGSWVGRVVRGDLGQTIENNSVNEEIGRRMWVSLRLVLIGAVLGSLLGVAAGAYGAVRQYHAFDYTLAIFSFVTLSIPAVVMAVLLKNAGIGLNNMLGFTGEIKLLYTTGEITPGVDPWSLAGVINRVAHLVLPSLVLTLGAVAFYGR